MKAEEFDKTFDEDQEDIIDYLDLSQLKRPGHEQRHIDIDFPIWWVAERLKDAIGS
jgi:hypothetical protein